MTTTQRFECDQCGACCRSLIVEANILDVLREPKLMRLAHQNTTLETLADGMHVIMLYDPALKRCPFLTNRPDETCDCSIYPTRPNECVACIPGGLKCQQARLIEMLPVLMDVDGQPPDTDSWSSEEWGEDLIEEIRGAVTESLLASGRQGGIA